MGYATPKGEITPVFSDRIKELEEIAKKQAESFRYQLQFRPWHTPESLKNANLYDTPGMHSPAWNRNKINEIYSTKVFTQDGGTSGDIIAMKLQCDFLAAEERAWRMRHASIVRCACVAHGRLHGHGSRNPSIFKALREMVDSYIQAGKGGFDGFTGDINSGSAAGIA